MKTTIYIFILVSSFVIPLSGQAELTAFSLSGEGRFSRSSQAVFWANPIFFKPAVFFSASEVNIRSNRKWWRNNDQFSLEPFIPHGYLPDNIATPGLLSLAITVTVEEYIFSQQQPQAKSLNDLPGESSFHLTQFGQNLIYPNLSSDNLEMPFTHGLKFDRKAQYVPNLYAQVAYLKL